MQKKPIEGNDPGDEDTHAAGPAAQPSANFSDFADPGDVSDHAKNIIAAGPKKPGDRKIQTRGGRE